MSRGPGTQQRELLDTLANGFLTLGPGRRSWNAVDFRHQDETRDPNSSALVRRAAHRLAREGVVELGYQYDETIYRGRVEAVTARRVLMMRLPEQLPSDYRLPKVPLEVRSDFAALAEAYEPLWRLRQREHRSAQAGSRRPVFRAPEPFDVNARLAAQQRVSYIEDSLERRWALTLPWQWMFVASVYLMPGGEDAG